jgi:ammonium transporter Rh
MSFLKWYGLGAVGLTMMAVAVAVQWALFTESFFEQLFGHPSAPWHTVPLNIYSLLNALYATSAILIAFGATIGKVTRDTV